MDTLAYAGYILVLIGGILLAIFGVLDLIGTVATPFTALGVLGATVRGLIAVIIGIVCIMFARYVGRLEWAIILIVLGIIATGPGGGLVILGGILGLISSLIKTKPK